MEKPNSLDQFNRMQVRVFKDAAKKAEGCCQWLAFIDTDEFIFPVTDYFLPQFLEKYEDYGAVTMNWQMFGTSNVEKLDPQKLMIEQLIMRAERNYSWNAWIKTIVQLKYLNWDESKLQVWGPKGWSPHNFPVVPGKTAVNSRFKSVGGWQDFSIPTETIRLHHYSFRDEEYFHKIKLNRVDMNPGRKNNLIKNAKNSNKVEDRSLVIYAEAIKEVVFRE